MLLTMSKPAAILGLALMAGCAGNKHHSGTAAGPTGPDLGRIVVSTVPFDADLRLRSATFTPSGRILVNYADGTAVDHRDIRLAVMDDDGSNLQTIFSGPVPERDKDNGIRHMIFADNTRIFMGDFILECQPDLDRCRDSHLYPVVYPEQVADGEHIANRWSEMIIAPDNKHVAWTTLFANYSAAMFTGRLEKQEGEYRIVAPRIISTMAAFRPDPDHPDGVLPNPVRNGEVKQFVAGGTAISLVGAKRSDIADSVVQDLAGDALHQITRNPGYDETTIFSPDEKLGLVMTSRFSDATDLKVLGAMPRPYPASLNMGLNMLAYTYSVTGVRKVRTGNIGPALIDIETSRSEDDYLGINLNTQDHWVYGSPMSWHPNGKKAMWMEAPRGSSRNGAARRIQVVSLPDYAPQAAVGARATPRDIVYGTDDMSALEDFLQQSREIDVKVYGRISGHIHYRRTARGTVHKVYNEFSDGDGAVYNGSERTQLNPRGNSTYTADITLAGAAVGRMDLQVTFGPPQGEIPAQIIFTEDAAGMSLSHGFTEYGGKRFNVEDLLP